MAKKKKLTTRSHPKDSYEVTRVTTREEIRSLSHPSELNQKTLAKKGKNSAAVKTLRNLARELRRS